MAHDQPVPPVRSAGVVLPVDDLTPTLTFFTDLGFELVAIAPAHDPRRATLSGFGLRLHLEPDTGVDPGVLRLTCDEDRPDGDAERVAPNGTRIELVTDGSEVAVPPGVATYDISRAKGASWTDGRAGMRYRDLVTDRVGGALIASLIHITDAGPMDDYVHYHRVAFQLIYCASGWVEVVYEDQGAPFVLEQGDAVLQPPGIRHQVRESSDELVVVEITVPAEHETITDRETTLPNDTFRPSRRFGGGQRFVRHVANRAIWVPWNATKHFEGQRLRIDVPTNHLAGAWTVRAIEPGAEAGVHASPATTLVVVLDGEAEIECDGAAAAVIGVGDAVTIPAQRDYRLSAGADLEMLLVTVNVPPDDAVDGSQPD